MVRHERGFRPKILEAEGAKQSAILRAEGERQSQIVRAEGQAKAIETVFRAIHDGDADPKLLAYQYLQVLPELARGDSNKVWLIPTEFSHALARFEAQFTGAEANGKVQTPSAQDSPPLRRTS